MKLSPVFLFAPILFALGCRSDEPTADHVAAEEESSVHDGTVDSRARPGSALFSRALYSSAEAHAVALAPRLEDSVLGGWFVDRLELDGTALESAGDSDIYLVDYRSGGEIAWSRRYGDEAQQELADIASGTNQRIAVTGNFLGRIDFGRRTAVEAASPVGLFGNAYVALLDRRGRGIWAQEMALDEGGTAVQVNEVALDGSGAVYVAGILEGTVRVAGNTIESGVARNFLLKFGKRGQLRWFQLFGGVDERVFGLDTDQQDRIFVATEDTRTGEIDVSAFSSGGDRLASASFPPVSVGAGQAADMTVTPDGTVYLAGQGVFGVQPDRTSYIAKLEPDLTIAGVRTLETLIVRELDLTPSGNLAIAGEQITGEGENVLQLEFAASLPFEGEIEWLRLFAGAGFTRDLGVTREGDVFLAGDLRGPFDIGAGAIFPRDESDLFVGALAR